MIGANYKQAAIALKAAVPQEHFKFLASLKTSAITGKYFLCHAGVRPGIPLERQTAEDLLWIRDEFLKSSADFGRIIVHGHTPREQPEICQNRINIDTGAFATGRLTCVVLDGEQPRFLMTP
jgi:serine/threonine protein phosphatase 1